MEPPVPHPCPRICVIPQSVSAIYHLGLWALIKPERLCCCSNYGRLLLFYLAARSLRLFITNRATALYECPQAQHHTVFWYSAATVLVCHYKKQCWTIKGEFFQGPLSYICKCCLEWQTTDGVWHHKHPSFILCPVQSQCKLYIDPMSVVLLKTKIPKSFLRINKTHDSVAAEAFLLYPAHLTDSHLCRWIKWHMGRITTGSHFHTMRNVISAEPIRGQIKARLR